MKVISIDLELNQLTPPKIIELGYVIANVKTKKIVLKKSILINPGEELLPEIVQLTGITQEMVNVGVSLTEAYNEMCSDIMKHEVNKHAIQWGTDHIELKNELQLSWDDYIFRRRGHDIKSFYQLYAMCATNTSAISGLSNSMRKLGIPFEGKQHRAADDALNTLKVMFFLQDKFKMFDQINKIVYNN